VLEYAVVMSAGDASEITAKALPALLAPAKRRDGIHEHNGLYVVPGKVA
jgi:hypothetical protein